jgi:hypothetical protein
MEPTVRNPRIESAIGLDAGISADPIPERLLAQNSQLIACRNPPAGNGIFGCGDRRPRIHPRDRYCRQRPGTSKIGDKIPAVTASFRSTTVSAVREDWVVVCAVICEPVSLLFGQYQGDFRKEQRTGGRKFQKRLTARAFLEHRGNSISGRNREAQLPLPPSEHWRTGKREK